MFITTLSGTELVVKENQVMVEFDPVHNTLAPLEEEVEKLLQTPSKLRATALEQEEPCDRQNRGNKRIADAMIFRCFIGDWIYWTK